MIWIIAAVWLAVSIVVGVVVGNYLKRLVEEHYPEVVE